MSLAKKIISLLIFNILAFGASAWGSYVTNLYKEPWQSGIVKPAFNPPDWVFAPVWITLYIAMSVAIWLVWINPKRLEKIIYIYFIHLLINGSCTKPNLRRKLFVEIKAANTHGTAAGKWSARKAQLLAKKYKALGGGYY